jgi:hypothetical protein
LERQLASLHRPLPSAGVTQLHRYYEPLRHPTRPGLSLASCQLIHTAITAGTSRVAHGPLCLHAVANTPAGQMEVCSLIHSIHFGLPRNRGGSAPASLFSGPAQRSLTLRPACSPGRLRDPLHQRLQQSCCLHCCSDCYRVERTSSRAGIPPLWTSAFTAHPVTALTRWDGRHLRGNVNRRQDFKVCATDFHRACYCVMG